MVDSGDDGRSVNKAIETDAYLISRTEDLIRRGGYFLNSSRIQDENELARAVSREILGNLKVARHSLHAAAHEFRQCHAASCKPHNYSVGQQVLLSTENINLKIPCKKLSPKFVGAFRIIDLKRQNAVRLSMTPRFKHLSPTINIECLWPYSICSNDIGSLPRNLDLKPIDVKPTGHSWYEIETSITEVRAGNNNVSSCVGRILIPAWIHGCHVRM
jgi:hypothetical protein